MKVDLSVLDKKERLALELKSLYIENGYLSYRMNKFEEYDLYAENKEFLVSDNVITFTDTDGKLMALKPDVTLSVIKNSIDDPQNTQKICYNENVYRVSRGAGCYKEIMQSGVECFGNVGEEETVDVIILALKSLAVASDNYLLALTDLDVLSEAVKKITPSVGGKEIYKAIGDMNLDYIESLSGGETLKQLLSLNGSITDILPELETILSNASIDGKAFVKVLKILVKSEYAENVALDFSIIGDANYYNGLVFKGYVKNLPAAVLSGGRYDNLLKKMKRRSKAIGFAVYIDELDEEKPDDEDDFLNVALPKGRLGEKVYSLFADVGYECPQILEPNRKLVFENPEKKIRYFWVKPSDIAIYVERGAADVGVAGKDIIDEYLPDVYELADLNLGKCRMAVAAPKYFVEDKERPLKVATKFSHIARNYYQSKGRDIDIIHLNGSIEIAPILKLSDVIVDIVETGRTLEENDLEVVEEIIKISARLIANKAAKKFKGKAIEELRKRLKEAKL